MMQRALMALITSILMLILFTACGAPDPVPGSSSRLQSGTGALAMSAPELAPSTNATSSLNPTPLANVTSDPIAQRALAHAQQHTRIKSGVPSVRLSRPVTPGELKALGIGSWNFTPGCVPPLHLVILAGDFDVRPAMPAMLPPGQELPAKFVVYVYDLKINEMIALTSDPNGGLVKAALSDPTLPDVDPVSLPHPQSPAVVPCTPIVVPGGLGPKSTSTTRP